MKDYIQFKAGPKIIDAIRDEGLDPKRIGALAGPAGGPKWFVSVGFDRMLMESRFLERGEDRVLLAGSSAGAYRGAISMSDEVRKRCLRSRPFATNGP